MTNIYVIGSLRNPNIPTVAKLLREMGYEPFADWYGAGERADDSWQAYETAMGRSYVEALDGYAANNVFSFDKRHLDRCGAALLVAPAGKSGHLELGYMIGQGKPGFVLLDGEPERWDVMMRFATRVFTDVEHMQRALSLYV